MTDIEQLQQENAFLRARLAEQEEDRKQIRQLIRTLAEKYGIRPGDEHIQRKITAALPRLMQTIILNPSSLEKDFAPLLPIIEKYSHE